MHTFYQLGKKYVFSPFFFILFQSFFPPVSSSKMYRTEYEHEFKRKRDLQIELWLKNQTMVIESNYGNRIKLW